MLHTKLIVWFDGLTETEEFALRSLVESIQKLNLTYELQLVDECGTVLGEDE